MAGKDAYQREIMRPGIDKANLVHGLEELIPSDRRRLAEAGGYCWFCDAKEGCEMCDTGKIADKVAESEAMGTPTIAKKRHWDGKSKTANKRLKTEAGGGMNQSPLPMLSAPFLKQQSQPYFPQQPYSDYPGDSGYSQASPSASNFNAFGHNGNSQGDLLANNFNAFDQNFLHYQGRSDPLTTDWQVDPALLSLPDTNLYQFQGHGQQFNQPGITGSDPEEVLHEPKYAPDPSPVPELSSDIAQVSFKPSQDANPLPPPAI